MIQIPENCPIYSNIKHATLDLMDYRGVQALCNTAGCALRETCPIYRYRPEKQQDPVASNAS